MKKLIEKGEKLSSSFITGAIALAFLVVGYQTALFIHGAAVTSIIDKKTHRDTVFVTSEEGIGYMFDNDADTVGESGGVHYGRSSFGSSQYGKKKAGKNQTRTSDADRIVTRFQRREYQSFKFNPNTVSVADLMRLGFSEKQAQSIENYRRKGGRFSRKQDFAKSFVVADSVYRRLEPFIDIPLVDINVADSSALDELPGIGGYFARRIVEYRKALGGFSYKEQLMDIKNFDKDKFDRLSDLISVGKSVPYPLWSLSEDSLAMHPYIKKYAAHGIVLYRENNPKDKWTVEALEKAGILDPKYASKLMKCRIASPD